MKAFTALFFLPAFSFLVEAKPEGLHPLNIVMPADPHNQTEAWRPNMKAQLPSPKQFLSFKNGTKSEPECLIFNGQPASRGQFPWQVAILIDRASFCGGSLISDTWILTAAHCTYNARNFEMLLGTKNIARPDKRFQWRVSSYSIAHEGYNNMTLNNDIALINLNQHVGFSLYISPVRLPSLSQVNIDFVGETVQCSGWGSVSETERQRSDTLQYANMSVITNFICAATFGSIITGTKICVSTADRRSPCYGDSGGPLVFREGDGNFTEVGIASFISEPGCESGYPAVFTRVTSYLNWIQNNTGIEIDTDIRTTTVIQNSTLITTSSHSWKLQALSRPVMGLLYLLYLSCCQ